MCRGRSDRHGKMVLQQAEDDEPVRATSEILRHHDGDAVVLFGAVVRGLHRERSSRGNLASGGEYSRSRRRKSR